MKKLLAAVSAMAVSALAQAQSPEGVQARPFLASGVTGGGDELVSVIYADGSTRTVHAGGLVDLKGGVDIRFANPFSLQFSLGYHFDTARGSNGSLTFKRMPLELLGFWHVNERLRIGGGVRSAMDPRVSSSGVLSGADTSFTSSTGAVLEGEYFVLPSLGIKLRAVGERYKIKGVANSPSYSGNHGGVYAAWYFH